MKRRPGTAQLNVEISKELAKRVRRDALELDVKVHEWASAAFEHYFEYLDKQRSKGRDIIIKHDPQRGVASKTISSVAPSDISKRAEAAYTSSRKKA